MQMQCNRAVAYARSQKSKKGRLIITRIQCFGETFLVHGKINFVLEIKILQKLSTQEFNLLFLCKN